MANNTGDNTAPGSLSEMAFQLHDLKNLTEQLSDLSESMQQTSAMGTGSEGSQPPPYYAAP